MKYVVARVYRKRKIFLDVPLIFPEMLSHDLVYAGLSSMLNAHYPAEQGYTYRALSAGSVSSMDCMVECHGHSVTLGLKSRGKADSKLIRMADYGSCMMPTATRSKNACCVCGTTKGLFRDGKYGYRCRSDGCVVL